MPTPAAAHGRVESLDLLRLFAALAVVVFHYSFRGAAADNLTWLSLPAISPVTRYGFLGVQLFFVISGFVIAWSAEGRTVREFAIARAARIYPGFLACMTITFVVLFVFGVPRFTASLTEWAANLFILAPALKQPFVDGVYWSIVYELIFYAWIAAIIGLGLFPRRLSLIVAAWLAISLANEVFLGLVPLRRLFLTDDSAFFAAGIMLYTLHAGRRTPLNWALLAAATVVAGLQGDWGTDWTRQHFGMPFSHTAVIAISVAAVALVAGALFVRRIPLPAKVVMALGGLTYPLYLVHQMVGFTIFNRLEGAAPPALIAGLTIVAMLALAWVIYRFVERPGQKLAKTVLRRLLVWPARPARRAIAPSVPVFGPVTLPRAARP